MKEFMRIDEFAKELKIVVPDDCRRYNFLCDSRFPYVVKKGIHYVEIQQLIKWLVQLAYEKKIASEENLEPTLRTIPEFTTAVGKYTNSYRHHLGEDAPDGYTYRLARGQVDDTCFEKGMTFYSLEEAIQGIKVGIENGETEFASMVCDGLLAGLTTNWEEIEKDNDSDDFPIPF